MSRRSQHDAIVEHYVRHPEELIKIESGHYYMICPHIILRRGQRVIGEIDLLISDSVNDRFARITQLEAKCTNNPRNRRRAREQLMSNETMLIFRMGFGDIGYDQIIGFKNGKTIRAEER